MPDRPAILVLYPAGEASPVAGLANVRAIAYSEPDEVHAALTEPGCAAAVLWSDALTAADLEAAVAAVRASGVSVIEVRAERWDGESLSPLSAACRGVLSGFGAAGVRAALGMLAREAGTPAPVESR
jgi:hypothetical protein